MALFSIVIPTRNRAHVLRYALQSALNQTFDDYEIVVSDNYSSDGTEYLVRQVSSSSKVRYFRTGKVLSMPDSWEFALNKADGEWVTILCDDDVLCPGFLNRINRIIEKGGGDLFVWPLVAYFDKEYSVSRLRNHLLFRGHTFRISKVNSRHALTKLGKFQSHTNLPRMLNSCCHKNVIKQVKKLMGRFFLPLSPDYTSCAALLSIVKEFSFVDIPARISGVTKDSIGRSFKENRGEVAERFINEFGDDQIFNHTPLQNMTHTNVIAESILRVKEALNGGPSELSIKWHIYYVRCFYELLYSKSKGADVSEEIKQLFYSLKKESTPLKTEIYCQMIISYFKSDNLRKHLKAVFEQIPILKQITSLALNRKFVQGKKAGFHNILEAAHYLENNS